MAKKDSKKRSVNTSIEAKNLSLKEELSLVRKNIDDASNLSLTLDYNLSLSTEKLTEANQNLTYLYDLNGEMNKYLLSINRVRNCLDFIGGFEKSFIDLLKQVNFLCLGHKYREANLLIDNFDHSLLNIDFGIELKLQRYITEILAYEKARVYSKSGRHNIEIGVIPLVNDELSSFYELACSLTTILHSEEEKNAILNTVILFICRYLVEKNNLYKENIDFNIGLTSLPDLFEKHKDILSKETLNEKNILLSELLPNYNLLCVRYFDNERNYEKALALFRIKKIFDNDKIAHPVYHDCKDEHEFEVEFIKLGALKMTPAEFNEDVKIRINNPNTHSLTFISLGILYAMPELQATKVEMIQNVFAKEDFQTKIKFYAIALEQGLDYEREKPIVDNLIDSSTKKLDLKECSKDLYVIKTKRGEQFASPINNLIRNIIRSPRAHKYIIKSRDPYLHGLAGEDINNIVEPIGKEYHKSKINYIDVPWFVAYWVIYALIAVFSIIITCFIPLELKHYSLLNRSLFYAIPFVFLTIVATTIMFQYYGRDERGSILIKRILAGSSIWKSILAFFTIILFDKMGVFSYAAFPLLIASFSQLMIGFFVFKDNNRKINYALYGPGIVLFLASLIAMIVALAQGHF